MRTKYQGVMTAIVTPFNEDGSIDYHSFEKLIEFQVTAGIHGLVVCGSTGEAATLSADEQTEVISFVVEKVNKRALVVGGASSNDTAQAVQRAEIVSGTGVDMLLSTSPYYNKPSQRGIIEHYRLQSDASKVPVIVYNVPGRTASNILPDTVKELEKFNNIIGIKEASGNVDQVMTILKNRSRDNFYIWLGEDNLTYPMMAAGADGIISVASNEIPAEFVNITEWILERKYEEALSLFYKIYDLLGANFIDSNPGPVKYVLHKMGYIKENYRLPLVPMPQEKKKQMDQLANQLGLY